MLLASGARAQFLWHVTHNERDFQYQYYFSALSCSGDNCIAAGLLTDYIRDNTGIRFWQSTDGGVTWKIEDPGIPQEIANNQIQYPRVVQQIDTLNLVAIGDSGLIVRTFNGGSTWQKQDCHSFAFLNHVHFTDSLTGIIVSNDTAGDIFTTSDGGRHWKTIAFGEPNFVQCHSYGGGNFMVFKAGNGTIYKTNDNWKTIDSTKPIFDSVQSQSNYLYRCNFLGTDTIVAYGNSVNGGLIIGSTDGGSTWGKHISFSKFSYIGYMTDLDRDTVLAAGFSASYILLSIDHGITWKIDTLEDDSSFQAAICDGLAAAGNGHFVSIFGVGSSFIIASQRVTELVHPNFTSNNISIFPNPATTILNVISLSNGEIVHIFDICGKEVLKGVVVDNGRLSLDISMLTDGFYSVLADRKGTLISCGKFTVIRQK